MKRALYVRVTPYFKQQLRSKPSSGDLGYALAGKLATLDQWAKDADVQPLSEFGLHGPGEWHSADAGLKTVHALLELMNSKTELPASESARLCADLEAMQRCLLAAAKERAPFRVLLRFSDRYVSPMDEELTGGWIPLV